MKVFCYLLETPSKYSILLCWGKGSAISVGMLSSSLGSRTQAICPGGQHRPALSNVIEKASSVGCQLETRRHHGRLMDSIQRASHPLNYFDGLRSVVFAAADIFILLQLATVFPAVAFLVLYHCHVVDKLFRRTEEEYGFEMVWWGEGGSKILP